MIASWICLLCDPEADVRVGELEGQLWVDSGHSVWLANPSAICSASKSRHPKIKSVLVLISSVA
jgi:hypothetical protein